VRFLLFLHADPLTTMNRMLSVPYRVLLILFAAAALPACDSALDLEPQQSISQDAALSTPANVETVLVGAYEQAGDYDLYGGQFKMLADLMGDDGDVTWTGTFEEPRQVWVKNILVTNGFIEDQWLDAYEVVNTANNVITALDLFEGDERDQIEGEARFLRAAMLFDLVRVYGKPYAAGDASSQIGVPIVLEPTRGISTEDNVPRASVQAVYEQVITDLTAARDLLPAENPRGFADYASTYTASAMLSRVYLMQENYPAAAAEASRVIESDLYALNETFAAAFNSGGGTEYIYRIRMSSQDNGDHSLNLFYASDANSGRGDVDINDQHVNRYEDGDARGEFFYIDGEGIRRTDKWTNQNAQVPVIRLAEMYLTRAEANFREGTSVGSEPIDDVNAIRERAGLDPIDSANLTLDRILTERRLELAFEGNLLHDLKRTGETVDGIAFDADRLVYPIPQREIDANPELDQNAGYGG